MDAVIPTEIGLPTTRTEVGQQDDANEELGKNLDWANEIRETASIRMADINKGQPLTTITRQGPRTLKVVRWSLERFSKIPLRQERESFKPIGQTPI